MKQDDSGQSGLKLKPGQIRKETHRFWKPRFSGLGGNKYARRLCSDFTQRGQVSIVKCRFEGRLRMTKKGLVAAKWASHGYYLSRRSAGIEGKPKGFNFEREDIQTGRTLGRWWEAGDERFFKFVISPERGDKVDLKEHARAVVCEMEGRLGTKLEWFGVVHNATDNPHVHLCIRGIDENKKSIFIDSEFIKRGMRKACEEKLTRELGLRRKTDILYSREKALRMDYYTAIDGAIIKDSSDNGEVHYVAKSRVDVFGLEFIRQKVERLAFLETQGLATKIGSLWWRIDSELKSKLKERAAKKDVYKRLSRVNKYRTKGSFKEEQKQKSTQQMSGPIERGSEEQDL